MKKLFKFGIIGCGCMAQSILKGVICSEFLRGKKIVVSDLSDECLDKADDHGPNCTKKNKYPAEKSEHVLIAGKPQSIA